METQSIKLGIIGCGNMAQALVKGCLIKNQSEQTGLHIESLSLLTKSGVRSKDFAEELKSQLNIDSLVAKDLKELVTTSDVLMLAVKPQQIAQILEELQLLITTQDASRYLLVSVAAGITLEALEQQAPAGCRVIRVMPNTPSLVGAGTSGYSLGKLATATDKFIVDCFLKSVGYTVEVEESLLNPLTAISGSGPAYIFRMLEVMIKAGQEVGLSEELSKQLTLHTFYGASLMALQSSDSPEELRIKVTSPNGTTAAALNSFNESGVEEMFKVAIAAATNRAQELAQ